jgi:hypothetical protein
MSLIANLAATMTKGAHWLVGEDEPGHPSTAL